jgi:hypothetical protein
MKISAKTKSRWMSELERELVERSPAHAGKINWDAALFHFHQGRDPRDAAIRMIVSEPPQDKR